jgi:hypothetical protein
VSSKSSRGSFVSRTWKVWLAALILAGLSFVLGASILPASPWIAYAEPHGTLRFVQRMLQESAIACLIALVVKELIESEYERRQHVAMVTGAAASRHAVLRILVGDFFDDETVERVYGTIFASTLVRENMTVSYIFSPHGKSPWLVLLDVKFSYTIRNPATITTHFNPHTVVANYTALFPHDEGMSTPKLKSVTIGDRVLADSEIETLNAGVDRAKSVVTFAFPGQELAANQSIDVEIDYEREKLVCDAEIFTMSYPTKKVTLIVENKCGPGMEFDITQIGQQGLSPPAKATEGAALERVNEGILLRDNGWVLFWNDKNLRPTQIPGPRPGTPAAPGQSDASAAVN